MEIGERDRSGFGYHLKAYLFRTMTAVLAWALVVAAYHQIPELFTSAQRLMQQGIEAIGDSAPLPWKYGWIVFREMGGVIWLQITMVILTLRIMLSTIAATWRLIFRETGPSRFERMSDPVALAVYGVLTLALRCKTFSEGRRRLRAAPMLSARAGVIECIPQSTSGCIAGFYGAET